MLREIIKLHEIFNILCVFCLNIFYSLKHFETKTYRVGKLFQETNIEIICLFYYLILLYVT